MNLFLQYKVRRDVVRNAAVLAPAQRSTVKRRVRSGHFDHDFWIFTLLLVGLRNENLQMLQNGANLAQPPEVER